MLHTALLLAPCANVNPPRTRSHAGTKQKLIRLFWSSFDNLLFTWNRMRKVLVNAPIQHGPFLPALSQVNSLILIFLCWTMSDSPFSKAFSTIITGIFFFCQNWLKLGNWFWNYHLHPTPCIQRSYGCQSLTSSGEMNGNEPLMFINTLAPKKGQIIRKPLKVFFPLSKQHLLFLWK